MNTEIQNIKEKADFIYKNSGIIWSKLNDPLKYEEAVNNLQVLLLCNYTLDEDLCVCKELLQSKTANKHYDNGYNASMKIIFYMTNFINNNSNLTKNKEALKDRLRQFTKCFYATNKELLDNNEFVKLKIKN